MPFISRVLRPRQILENGREYSKMHITVVQQLNNAKIKDAEIIS